MHLKRNLIIVSMILTILFLFNGTGWATRPFPKGFDPQYIPSDQSPLSERDSSAQSIAIPFFDDVENGINGWSTTGFWHIVTNPDLIRVDDIIRENLVQLPDLGYLPPSYSGSSCWWYGEDATGTFIGADYDPNQSQWSGGTSTAANEGSLISPSLDLSGVEQAVLNFYTWWEIEGVDVDTYDMMHVEISTDGGITYQPLGDLNPLNDSDSHAYIGYSTGGVNVPGKWGRVYFDLTDFVGEIVTLRFRFETIDASYNGFRGWFIDDISVSATPIPELTLTEVVPNVGSIGDVVSVFGSGFVKNSTLTVGGESANAVVIFDNKILAYIPNLPDGTYDITVTIPSGDSATLNNGLSVSEGLPPTVNSINPSSGSSCVTTDVTITGENFLAAANASFDGDALLNVTVLDPNTITATVPAGVSPGWKNVYVTNPDDLQDVLYSGFQVLECALHLDIKANGSDGPLTISQSELLSLAINLNAAGSTDNADWWILGNTPMGWYRLAVPGGWGPGISVTHQGPLFDLASFTALSATGLPLGDYTFYFGVDTEMNGAIDMGSMVYDSVKVNIGTRGFFEDFNDGIADNWIDDGTGRWSIGDGVYIMDSNSLVKVATSYYNVIYEDFELKGKVNKILGSGLGWYNGLMAKLNGSERYLFIISPSGSYCLWKNLPDGSGIFLIEWTHSDYINTGFNSWNTLKIKMEGSFITLFINGNHVDDYNDPSYIKTGYAGLMSKDVDGREVSNYDDVSLSDLSTNNFNLHRDAVKPPETRIFETPSPAL